MNKHQSIKKINTNTIDLKQLIEYVNVAEATEKELLSIKSMVQDAVKKRMSSSDYNSMCHAYMYITQDGKGMFADVAEELLGKLIRKFFLDEERTPGVVFASDYMKR